MTYKDNDKMHGGVHFSPGPEQEAPFFTIEDPKRFNLSSVLNSKSLELTAQEISFVTAVYDLCAMESSQVIDIGSLKIFISQDEQKTRVLSTSALRKRLSVLIKKGVFIQTTLEKKKNPKAGRASSLFVLQNNTENTNKEITKDAIPYDLSIKVNTKSDLMLRENQPRRFDDFWCQIITGILPINDQSKAQHITGKIKYIKGYIPVTITSQSDSRIPTIRSIKTVIAMLTLVEIIIKTRKLETSHIQTNFTLHLKDILYLMGLENKGANRRNILRHIVEWSKTQFKFEELPHDVLEEINKKFKTQSYGFSTHQLIQQLRGVGVKSENQKTPSIIQFELPLDLVNRITDDSVTNLFTISPSIMGEQSPMAIALHLYCRKKIGHRSHVLSPTIKTLWGDVQSSMKFKDFKASLNDFLEKRQEGNPEDEEEDNSVKIAKIHGYVISKHKDTIVFAVDAEDQYVGSNSRHKKLKQKAERELSSKLSKKYSKK
jgi:hypothetical protein